MSFSSDVKDEICKQTGTARHCQIAEFAALFALIGNIKIDRYGEPYLRMHTENLTVAGKSYILLKKIFGVEVDVSVRNHNFHAGTLEYSIVIKRVKDVISILKAVKIMDEQNNQWGDFSTVHPLIVQNICCRRAFLRGAFLVAGSITNPEKAYHLEIAVLSEKFAEQIRQIISFFEIDAKIVERKKYFVVYVKEGAQIVDFLNIIGAHKALMEFENIRILKEVRNSVNRQVNCETANISKTLTAAARQIEDIEYIQQNMGLGKLADGLREVAELRLEYPEKSLLELGNMLSKPLGKSGVNHRLRKLGEIAEQLREERNELSPIKED